MATRTRDLTNQVNGITTTFSTPEIYIPGTLEVYLNGVRQRRDIFFTETGANLFGTTESPEVGDSLFVQFEVEGAGDVIAFPIVVPSGITPGSG